MPKIVPISYLIVLIFTLLGQFAVAQDNIIWNLPPVNIGNNTPPSFQDRLRQEQERRMRPMNINTVLVPPIVISPIYTCSRALAFVEITCISPDGLPVAFCSSSTSPWAIISRNGRAILRLIADTTIYLAQMSPTLDTLGPRTPFSFLYQPPPPPLAAPETLWQCPNTPTTLTLYNPGRNTIEYSGVINSSTRESELIIPANTPSGRINFRVYNRNRPECYDEDQTILLNADEAPDLVPRKLNFCVAPTPTLFASPKSIRYEFFRNITDSLPFLSVNTGEYAPAAIFNTNDTILYVAAVVNESCKPRKQRVVYRIYPDSISAGPNVESCINKAARMNAQPPITGQIGRWQPNPGITIADSSDPRTTIITNRPGNYDMLWKITTPGCGERFAATKFVCSGYGAVQIADTLRFCGKTSIKVPYLADTGLRMGVYVDNLGRNLLQEFRSGDDFIFRPNPLYRTIYVGYKNDSCRPPLKKVVYFNPLIVTTNFGNSYDVCNSRPLSFSIQEPIKNLYGSPIGIGDFSCEPPANIVFPMEGSSLEIKNLVANNIYKVSYSYYPEGCDPIIRNFTISTVGVPPTPVSDFAFRTCRNTYTLSLPAAPLGMTLVLKRGLGVSKDQTSSVITLDLTDSVEHTYYYYYKSNKCGSGAPKTIRITKINPFLGIAKLKDTSITAGAPIVLGKGLVFGSGNFLWSNNLNGETISGLDAIANPIKSTTYYLTVSADDCFYYDTLNVIVKGTIEMPNLFSPNGNGKNESFGIPVKFSVNTAIELVIVNKFGQTVFAKSGKGIRWDGTMDNGKEAPQDIYYYRIKFRDEGDELTGFVQLVR